MSILNPYAVGDTVIAVETYSGLTKDEEYTVTEIFREDGFRYLRVKNSKGRFSGGWLPTRFKKKEGCMSPIAEKIQTLADLIDADPENIKPDVFAQNIYHYNDRKYLVITEEEKSGGSGTTGATWCWLGQLGNTHVFRKNKD